MGGAVLGWFECAFCGWCSESTRLLRVNEVLRHLMYVFGYFVLVMLSAVFYCLDR
jgi:hypothetical protein